jgi:Na+/proline symporter
MVFVSFQFNKPPIIFKSAAVNVTEVQSAELGVIEKEYDVVFNQKKELLESKDQAHVFDQIRLLQVEQDSIRTSYKDKLVSYDIDYEAKDSDYIFLSFVLNYLPVGLIGLLLAVIFSAAMSSTAGELNALAATTTIDFYKKYWSKSDDEKKDLRVSKLLTVAWGCLAIMIALVAGLFENLIELVNLLGSLFYGTILGVFLLAFFFKRVKAKGALFGAIIGQVSVGLLHVLTVYEVVTGVGYLWYNVIGCTIVILVGVLSHWIFFSKKSKGDPEVLEN